MQITKLKMPESKYSIKCPYEMKAEGVTVHNTYNDASAMSEASYMTGNDKKVSFHEVVDDYRVVHCIDFNRNSWNAGDGSRGFGNRKTIAIEICHSKSGGEKFDLAERNGAKRIAQILKEENLGIDTVGKHQDRSKKYCPHRTLDLGWERFLNMIREELGQAPTNTTNSTNSNENTNTDDKKEVIRKLQHAYNVSYNKNLDEDGVVGEKTKAVMKKYCLKNFTENELARWVQDRLVHHKRYSVGTSGIDGRYGKDTENTVKAFQRDNGLKVDGYAGYNTISILI